MQCKAQLSYPRIIEDFDFSFVTFWWHFMYFACPSVLSMSNQTTYKTWSVENIFHEMNYLFLLILG